MLIMTPQQKEIIALNREIGEAQGLLLGVLCNHYKDMSETESKTIREFLDKVRIRKSHLEE